MEKWLENVKDADKVFVLDTGSTDRSLEILKKSNVIYQQKIYPQFRFDVARNDSLQMVDEDCDVCICCDIDERFNTNWRNIIESVWKEDTQLLSYRYTWSFTSENKEGVVFYIQKIHARHGFIWKHPVHEVLVPVNQNIKPLIVPQLQLYHYADTTKARSHYLPLLELSVLEDPEDDRNMHYLGREYMFYKEYDKAITTLQKHLQLKKATWKDERAASYRFIGRCYQAKGDISKAKSAFYQAIAEAPYLREAFLELAFLLFEEENFIGTLYFVEEALKIENRSYNYISEPHCWDETFYDLASLACYHLHDKEKALYYVDKALQYSPNNERIKKNKEFYLKMN